MPRRLWHWIAEPRVQRAAYFVIYLMHVLSGAAIILGQPDPVAHAIGAPLTAAWGMFLAGGGLIGAIAVLPGWNFVERIGIVAVLFGVALCSVVILGTPGLTPGTALAFWALVAAWVVVFLLRAYEIRMYSIAPSIRRG